MARTSFRTALALLIAFAAAAVDITASQAQQLTGGKRLALVIGNSAYRNVTPLINPVNDATDIAAKLKTLQFDVLLGTDVTHAKMSALLDAFKAKVTREHVALVFYAGHGVTVNRESFLLAIDTPSAIEVDDKGELRGDAANRAMISMASVLTPLEASRIGIVFLDACRNSAADAGLGMTARTVSLGKVTRSVPVVRGTGSLEIKPSPHSAGVFRAYATQLNNVASDGAGRNSPFTKALLKHIGTKGITIQDLMIRVRKSVMEDTKNEQIPWEEAALNEPFSFVQTASTSTGAATGGGAANNSAAAKPAAPRKNNVPPNVGVGIGTGL